MEGLGADRRWVLGTLLCALLVVTGALGATASEVVDVRVGTHPGFTRVVFELDTPAGYRIERDSPSAGVSELVISINATSIPRRVQPKKQSLIGTVRVAPQGNRTVARIELKRSGLRLKEMILTNPPRIVLDVLKPTPPKTAAKPKPAPKPKVAATPKPAPKPTPEPTPAPEPAVKPAPKPVAKFEAKAEPTPTPTPTPAPPKPAPTALAPKPTPESTKPALARPKAEPRREEVKFAPSDGSPPPSGPSGQARPPALAKKQTPGAKPPSPRPTPTAEAEEGSGYGMIIAGVLAVLMVVFGVLFVLRRRSAGSDDEDEEEVEDAGFVGEPLTEDNPFAGLGSADGSQPPLPVGGPPAASDEPDLTGEPTPIDAPELDFGDLTSGAAEEPNAPDPIIDMGSADDVSMEIGGEDVAAAGIGADVPAGGAELDDDMDEESEEAMRMMRELERRIGSLETRLDELVDSRERLERQVAAQTEELRVQRAAIARTQRAVRNMTRPDDEGPTEPALRDPS